MVLINLLVLPKLKENNDVTMVYGFEELENNLHPAMQRKLFDYIYKYAVENEVNIFITTHSHVAINMFTGKEDSSVYHVMKNEKNVCVKKIESYLDKVDILEDLDVKASDLLQANGIIWVEGPSDRIYIRRWLEIFMENKFVEGKDFQFLYYGGRLLSHYSAEEATELISIITTNRNAAIVIDSDKKSRSSALNETKKRIINEFNNLGMFSWVTKGKEIENYISKDAIGELVNKKIRKQCEQYAAFPKYIKTYYNNFEGKKVRFASDVSACITAENSANILDLKKMTVHLYDHIAKWNEQV